MRVNKRRGRLRVSKPKEEVNPMEGLANLADLMLVFACGLLMALIVSLNVNVNAAGAVEQPSDRYEIEGVEENQDQVLGEGEALEEMGKVYKDPNTGKYYVVEGE